MADFAGYAGAILQVAGSATGQIWLQVAGMAVSAWGASQQVIPGPKIGDIQQQTAQEGGPRPIVFGRSHPIAGNIIADGGPRIVVTRERQGKGGPKVESESAFRTYAVGFSEGEADLLQVWRNNTLVYDAEDPSMAAENAEFLTYARWFRGDYQQMPSPDLEAVLGVGNVHGHRGTAYLVLADEDVTDQRGSWSQWKVRVFRGAAKSYTTPPYLVHVEDSLDIIHVSPILYGSFSTPIEDLNVALSPLGGQVKSVRVDYDQPPEDDIQILGVTPLGGFLKSVRIDYAHPPEEMAISTLAALGGEITTVLLRYQNYEPEEIDISPITPLGGQVNDV